MQPKILVLSEQWGKEELLQLQMIPRLPQLRLQLAPPEFESEAREPPVRADPPEWPRRRLAGASQLPAGLLLDQ